MIKNDFFKRDDYIVVITTRRNGEIFEVLIDEEDLSILDNMNARLYVDYAPNNDGYYAKFTKYLGKKNGKNKYTTYALGRLILGLKPEQRNIKVDHINHNGLDDRKSNIRTSTNKNNTKNRKGTNSNNKSGYRNIIFSNGKYVVQLQVDGKCTRMGSFEKIEDAIDCAEKMRKIHYKEFSGNK